MTKRSPYRAGVDLSRDWGSWLPGCSSSDPLDWEPLSWIKTVQSLLSGPLPVKWWNSPEAHSKGIARLYQ